MAFYIALITQYIIYIYSILYFTCCSYDPVLDAGDTAKGACCSVPVCTEVNITPPFLDRSASFKKVIGEEAIARTFHIHRIKFCRDARKL